MAFDTFLKINGLVDSATTAAGHAGEIEVLSFSWGASNPGAVGLQGPVAGKVNISSFNLMKKADVVSPALFLACAQGSRFLSASVTMTKTGATPSAPFIEYDLTNVIVESIQWSGSSGGDDTPTESVSLGFTKVVYKSSVQKPDGTVATAAQTGWDLAANKQA